MDAAEAEKRGLVSKVVPADQLLDTVVAVAEKIASNSKLINQVCLKTSSFLVIKAFVHSTFFSLATHNHLYLQLKEMDTAITFSYCVY